MPKVSVIHCQSYDRSLISSAIRRHFDNLGGIEKFISPGERVLIKPNLICPKGVEQPAQTHPAVICETAAIVIAAGAKAVVADSPAWSDTPGCLKALGAYTELRDMGVEIKELTEPVKVVLPFGGIKASISREALEADKIINLPKLKAHQQMGATIAVKNMFGAVVGKRKALWHYRRGESPEMFAQMLLGIYFSLNPIINIIDAVTAMEGQGPINGRPKHIGLLLASQDAIACEVLCAKILGIAPDALPVVNAAEKLNAGCFDTAQIQFVGDEYRDYICVDFLQARQSPLKFTLPRICKSVFKQLVILLSLKSRR